MRNAMRTIGLVALLAVTARGDDWPHMGRDDGRTRAPAEAIISPVLLDSVATGAETVASPVVADGFLVAAALGGTIRAYRESDLALLWTVTLASPVIGTPAIDRGRLYVPCTDGRLYVRRLADGASLGTVATGGADQSSPVVSGSRLFLASGFPNISLLAIDTAGPAIAWSAPLDQVTNSSPAIAPGRVLIASNSGRLYAMDSVMGSEIWNYLSGGTVGPSAPLVEGGSVYLLAGTTLHKVALATGAGDGSLTLTDPAQLWKLLVAILVIVGLFGTADFHELRAAAGRP
jgi:outer membrane protein assembly factor BamB